MKIVADANMAGLKQSFGRHANLTRKNGRDISAADLHDADVLLVRSVTRVDENLLANSRVTFVGTATIGTDHLDTQWLSENGISWASAPGCNADAAAQYTLAMAWLACERRGIDPQTQGFGIIGRGNVGSRLQALLATLDIPSVACDPPLADKGERRLVSLEEALDQDVICLHVPLTDDGPYPTRQMLADLQFSRMKEGVVLVNSSRGDVLDGHALLQQCRQGRVHAALDVWPGEPRINLQLLEHTVVATPHVAGYSVDGKLNGTRKIYEAFCRWRGISPQDRATVQTEGGHPELPATDVSISEILSRCCNVQDDDLAMRGLLAGDSETVFSAFDLFRANYRLRRDFSAWTVSDIKSERISLLRSLGFRVPEGPK